MVTALSPVPYLSLPPPLLSAYLSNPESLVSEHHLLDSDSDTHSSLSTDTMDEHRFHQPQSQSYQWHASKSHSLLAHPQAYYYHEHEPLYSHSHTHSPGGPVPVAGWSSQSQRHRPSHLANGHDVNLSPSLSTFSAPQSQYAQLTMQYKHQHQHSQPYPHPSPDAQSQMTAPMPVQASYATRPLAQRKTQPQIVSHLTPFSPPPHNHSHNHNVAVSNGSVDCFTVASLASSPSVASVSSTPAPATQRKSKATNTTSTSSGRLSAAKPKLRESASQPNLRAHCDSVALLTSSSSTDSIDQLDDPDAIFVCPHCPRKFTRNSNLTRHKRIHTGIKRFECDDCSKSFMERHHLVAHRRTHTGEKPFRCSQCTRTFTDRSNRNRHIRTHGVSPPPSPLLSPEPALFGNSHGSLEQSAGHSQERHANGRCAKANSQSPAASTKHEPVSPAFTPYHPHTVSLMSPFPHTTTVFPALVAVPTPIPAAIPVQAQTLALTALSPLHAPRVFEVHSDASSRKSSIDPYSATMAQSVESTQAISLMQLNSPSPASIYSPDFNKLQRLQQRGRNYSFSLSPGLHAIGSPVLMPLPMSLGDMQSSPTLMSMAAPRATAPAPQQQAVAAALISSNTAIITPRAQQAAASLIQAAAVPVSNGIRAHSQSQTFYFSPPASKRSIPDAPVSSIDMTGMKRVKLEQVQPRKSAASRTPLPLAAQVPWSAAGKDSPASNVIYAVQTAVSLPVASPTVTSATIVPSTGNSTHSTTVSASDQLRQLFSTGD